MEGFSEIRLGLYSFLSSVFNYPPDVEKLKMFDDPDVKEVVVSLFPSSEVIFRWKENSDRLKLDFNELFMVPGSRYLKPYESVYLESPRPDGAPGSGLLMGQLALDVKKHYDRAGFKISPYTKELPDYIGVELEFMASLTKLENQMRNEQDDFSSVVKLQKEFLEEHLSRWIPMLVEGIKKNSETNFYIGVANILSDFILKDLKFLCENIVK